MNKLLETLLIGLITAKSPKAGRIYSYYGKYARPLIRAERYYGHNKKAGMDTKLALMKAATDAEVPLDLLTDLISKKTGDVGKIAVSTVLGETQFADPDKTSYKTNF